jgi:very-short-patch-repair endonuclease
MAGPSANSPLERLLQAALVKAGISFSTQRVLLDRYCVDILLVQSPVVIEADGALHRLRKDQDTKRDTALSLAGYKVFRFTGKQINSDPDRCIREVLENVSLEPDVNPRTDIRNGMCGDENPQWRGGARALICTQCGEMFREDQRNARSYKKKFCNARCYGAWLRDHPESCNRRLKIDWSKLPEQYASGMTITQLSERYGYGRKAIRNAMARLGVVGRSPGERHRRTGSLR